MTTETHEENNENNSNRVDDGKEDVFKLTPYQKTLEKELKDVDMPQAKGLGKRSMEEVTDKPDSEGEVDPNDKKTKKGGPDPVDNAGSDSEL